MRAIPAYTVLFVAFISLQSASADTIDAADRTQRHTVKSTALGEKREIFVRTPPNYRGDGPLPVVFVTDAEWNFELVAAAFDFLTDNGAIPPVIVTGVRNVNRNRDFLPRSDSDYDDSGEADAFLAFVQNDWAPLVDEKYSSSDDRVLIGHSFGGVFALHAFFQEPEFFKAFIALSPSSWVADRVLFEEASALFGSNTDFNSFVYIAVGEGDGGPTTPSSRELAELFEANAPASLDWSFDIMPKADHFWNFTGGLNAGMMKLFPAFGFAEEARQAGEANGAAGVNSWFDEKESALGFRFFPSWFDFGIAAIRLSHSDRPEAGLAVIKRAKKYHAENANFAAFAAQVHENAGEFNQAISEYERAIMIAKRDGLHPNAIHLDRLNAGVARIKAKKAEAGD
ncbi:MAG TPA: alpha/beta fold hydrolase [Parvularculaceae bacterium]|nr:alpha/beta fold hydrolase [Parvularculaceae bacterium]